MDITGDQMVGKTLWLRHRVMNVDPRTEVAEPELNAQEVIMRILRPDGTTLGEKQLGFGIQDLGDGYFAANFTPDVAGRHTVQIEARAFSGNQDRFRDDLIIHRF